MLHVFYAPIGTYKEVVNSEKNEEVPTQKKKKIMAQAPNRSSKSRSSKLHDNRRRYTHCVEDK